MVVTSGTGMVAVAAPPRVIWERENVVKSEIDKVITHYPSAAYQVKADVTDTNMRKYYSEEVTGVLGGFSTHPT